jgi:hypothetical protein
MAVDSMGNLIADRDAQSTDFTGMQRDRMRKQGISQPGIIGLTLDELKTARDIVTVTNASGEPRAVHQDTLVGIKREIEGPAELRGHDAGLSAGFDLGYDAGFRAAQQQP